MGKPIQAMCLSIGIVSLVALYLQQINMDMKPAADMEHPPK